MKYLFELPKNLKELQFFMGKCPSCEQVTENLLICLICGWKICSKERENILNHTKVHNGSMFIKCDSGSPVYSFKGGLFKRPSLYLNYLG